MFDTRLKSVTINVENGIFNCPVTVFVLEINENNGEWNKHTNKECIKKIRRDDTVMSTSFNIRQGTRQKNLPRCENLTFYGAWDVGRKKNSKKIMKNSFL
jgi:hypothetical protein